MKKVIILIALLAMAISCTTKADNMLIKAKILKAEDSRNGQLLTELSNSINSEMQEEGKLIAIASGRISSFESFEIISNKFKNNIEVTDLLSITTRFPRTNFDKTDVFNILKEFSITEDVIESMLYLNTKEGFDFALKQEGFNKTIAANLWRSKDFATKEVLQKYYQLEPEASVYSLFKLKNEDIAKAEDVLKMDLNGRAYGCAICDNPETFLNDKEWQVRVIALNTVNTKESSSLFLNDPNILVKQTAYEVYLKNKGKLKYETEKLTPIEAEIILKNTNDEKLATELFEKEGILKEIGAAYLGKDRKDNVIGGKLTTNTKLQFLEKNFSKEEALNFAMDEFMFNKDKFGLIYVIDSKENLLRKQAVEKAITMGGEFISILTDYKDIREGYKLNENVNKPLSYYLNILNTINQFQGFTIKTEKGDIGCKFFQNQAPLTCYNTISLIKKDYYKNLFFHRIVPAFVAQDGDPTGTGSGGPGYSIRCEYNKLKYNKKGMVGMALSGKDTGGSQYFLTHLATSHLNHQYTIFAEMEHGDEILDNLQKYDRIYEITLNSQLKNHE